MHTGTIFNIQKCSIHDGPGLRTLVFLKGCPLRCLWCANPESQAFGPELTDSPSKCIGCAACVAVCPHTCLSLNGDGRRVDFARCDNCGECVTHCHAKALQMAGENKTPEGVVETVLRDRAYYARSGGGVTFSGDEPLSQPDFLLDTARRCKKADIHVTIETCGCGDFTRFAPVLEFVDLVFFNLKCADPERHKALTGLSNEKILRNLAAIDDNIAEMIIRIPVIPGCNDDDDNLQALAAIIRPLKSVRQVELMTYHTLGEPKYAMLGRGYELHGVQPSSAAIMEYCVDLMNAALDDSGKTCFYEKA
ncbi:MAG: glycyl-radical enzyme activating protein [Planctomycetaceae bacterium]|nr:glycyl-radical enzyme activating protein [Planctomycetaceae bacterium]